MKKLFIITGEHSGDKHAADVVSELKKSRSDIEIEAVGGENLQKTGVKLFSNHAKMSAVGLSPTIIFEHFTFGKRLVDYLKNEYKPDMILLVDYGVFNLSIAKVLKKEGIKLFYYIPPQIWASRKWRIKTVKKYIDKVITIFPFENKMYENEGIDVEFAGHPILSQLPQKPDRHGFFMEHGLDESKKLVSIFPGSRAFEIKELLKTFIKAAEIMNKKNPKLQFALCQAPSIKDEWINKFVPSNIKIIKAKNYELLALSDALMLASGTVALEAAIYETPMIISYKGPWFFYLVYLLVRCIKMVSLPNIILGKLVVPELIQKKAKPEIIAQNLLDILENETCRTNMCASLKNVKNMLASEKAAEKTSKIISENI